MKIGWLLCGDENFASSRIQGYNIHKYLISQNIDSRILFSPKTYTPKLDLDYMSLWDILIGDLDIVIFQKIGGIKAVIFTFLLKLFGKKTIYMQCDLFKTYMHNAANYVIVTTNYLKDYILKYKPKVRNKITVIDDAIEVDRSLVKKHKETLPIKIVWIGNKDNWNDYKLLKDKLKHDYFKHVSICDHPDATVKWALNTFAEEILKCDVAIIPRNSSSWDKAKSTNRLTMFMSLGIPVLCYPISSYLEIIDNNENAILVNNDSDWEKYLLQLSNHNERIRISLKAKKVCAQYYVENIASQWITVFKKFI